MLLIHKVEHAFQFLECLKGFNAIGSKVECFRTKFANIRMQLGVLFEITCNNLDWFSEF